MTDQIKVIIQRPFGVLATIEGHNLTGLSAIFGPKGTDAFILGNTLYINSREKIPQLDELSKLPTLQLVGEANDKAESADILTIDGIPYFAHSHIERRCQTADQTTITPNSVVQQLQTQIDEMEQAHKQEIRTLQAEQKIILQQMTTQCEIVREQLRQTEKELMATDRNREALLLQTHRQLEEYKKMAKQNADLPEIILSELEELPQIPVEKMVKDIAGLQQQNEKLRREAISAAKKSQQQIEPLQAQLTELRAKLDIVREENQRLQDRLKLSQTSKQPDPDLPEFPKEQLLDYEVVPIEPEVPDDNQLLTQAFHHVLIVFTLHFKKEMTSEKETIPAIINLITQEISSILNGSHSLMLDYPFSQEAEVVVSFFTSQMNIQENNDFGKQAATFIDKIKDFLTDFLKDLLIRQTGPQRVNTLSELKAAYDQYLGDKK